MKFCTPCLNRALRQWPVIELVTEQELKNPSFLVNMRGFTSALAISADDWIDYLCDLYCEFNGIVVDAEGHTIGLNTELLDIYREWYRDWVNTPVGTGVIPRLHAATKSRVRVIATILKTAFYEEVDSWAEDAANDN